MSDFSELREQCLATNLNLHATGLVDLTFGNASVCDPSKAVFAIKPSGVPYEKLTAASMVIVDFEGKVIDGELRPSSDMPTHRRLFQAFPHIRSVVHTHSRHAVAFSQAGMDLPLFGTTHADYFHGPVPVTREMTAIEITTDYEWQTGNVIVERFQSIDPEEISAVLVRNHGPFIWGTSGSEAVEIAQALEIIAEMAWRTLSLNPNALPPSQTLIDKHFLRKHGATRYYGQTK